MGRQLQHLLDHPEGGKVLIPSHSQRGITLIEILIGLVIVGLLFGLAIPSFRELTQNSQIRTAAEAIQNGLQLARSEAVRRNAMVRFQLTSSVDNTCGLSAGSTNWVVSQDDPSLACDTPPSDTVPPRIVQTRAAAEGSRKAVAAAGQSTIVFNGLGRITPAPVGDISICIGIAAASCPDSSGEERRLQLVVSPGGQVRLCDPNLSQTDAQGC